MWDTPLGPAEVGKGAFTALVSAGFLLCCGACLLTADVISSERREGTLILLFLTRVKAFDVLLGKLASAGLAGFCALIACAPLLIIPILAGGVTAGEAVRKSLVLMDTMFLALAVGLWASTKGTGWLKRARHAVGLLVLIAVLPVASLLSTSRAGWAVLILGLLTPLAIWCVARGSGWLKPAVAILLFICLTLLELPIGATRYPAISLCSPLMGLFSAGDLEFKASHARYWISLGIIQSAGWAVLGLATLRLRKSLRLGAGDIESLEKTSGAMTGEEPTIEDAPDALREEKGRYLRWSPRLYQDPIEWLLAGYRGIKALVWAGAAVGFFQYGVSPLLIRFVGFRSSPVVFWPYGFAVTALQGSLFAAAAGWFFVQARRSGELELLITTPVGATTILSAQWNRLKRILQWPAAVMIAPIGLTGLISLMANRGYPLGPMAEYFLLDTVLRAVDVAFGMAAICWTGLWFGLTTRTLAGAIVWTVGLVKGVPFLFTLGSQLVLSTLVNRYAVGRSGVVWLVFLAPQVLILLYYVKLIKWARRRLSCRFAPVPVKSSRLNRPCEMAPTSVEKEMTNAK
jgi:hypothetical protein